MAIDTTAPSYWLNWRFLLTAIYVLSTTAFAAFLIWKHEGAKRSDGEISADQVPDGVLYQDEVWRSNLKIIHPAWLLGFRTFAFLLLLGLIIGNTIVDGPIIFVFYTQWTFTLTTIFFGYASAISLFGLWRAHGGACDFKGAPQNGDAEQGSDVTPRLGGFSDYLLQILYQVSAGAVVLTDIVWWLILYPFMTPKDYKLSFFDGCMHSLNFLVFGDTILNNLRFPSFRIAYFILWTTLFVIVQWIIHAITSTRWPYPFMDLSSPFAPLWYAAVGLLHIPSYGFFALVVILKRRLLSKLFPESYQGIR